MNVAAALLLGIAAFVLFHIAKERARRPVPDYRKAFKRVAKIEGFPADVLHASPRRCAQICNDRLCGAYETNHNTWKCSLYLENGFGTSNRKKMGIRAYVRR